MKKTSYKVIGLMSGTSLDGVDAALVNTDGEHISGFGAAISRAYSEDERQVLHAATQDALAWKFSGPPPNSFAHAEMIIHHAHIEAVEILLDTANMARADIDLIGFHGQTVLHRAPKGRKNAETLQLGDGHVLANALGIDTVFDFRSNDVKHGGQGAPLAPIFHHALVAASNLEGTIAVLNIGGVSNVTLIRDGEIVMATDCGPGNGPLDSWIESNGLGSFDKDGHISRLGTPDVDKIAHWLQRQFFTHEIPKSADRWDFDVLSDMVVLSPEDGAATLVAFCAESIRHTLNKCSYYIDNIIVCGGGRRNPILMSALKAQGFWRVSSAEDCGWRGDDIEAQAFAYMALRSRLGLALSFPQTTGVKSAISGGILAKGR